MLMTVTQHEPSFVHSLAAMADYDDPLDVDTASDDVILTTRRGLVRLALVASETGARFAREGVSIDPVAWMLAPRHLFDGRAAIEACLHREECLRAILLHGLSIGLDAYPEDLDELVAVEDVGPSGMADDGMTLSRVKETTPCNGRPKLWTSLAVGRCDDATIQAFDAVIAEDREEAERSLRARHGASLLEDLEIVEGFDATLPLAEALVSPALADMLEQVAQDPSSPLAEGLSVSIHQRFSA